MKAYRESQRARPQANKQNGARLWHRGRRVRQSELNGIIKSANNAKFYKHPIVEVCGKAASHRLKGDTVSGPATDREHAFIRIQKPFTLDSESAWVNVSCRRTNVYVRSWRRGQQLHYRLPNINTVWVSENRRAPYAARDSKTDSAGWVRKHLLRRATGNGCDWTGVGGQRKQKQGNEKWELTHSDNLL